MKLPRMKILWMSTLVVVIAGTHWSAFAIGKKREHQRTGKIIWDTVSDRYDDQLRASIAILKVMVKHPSGFKANELIAQKQRAEMQLISVEKDSLVKAQKSGNTDLEKQLSAEIATAKELLEKLPAR